MVEELSEERGNEWDYSNAQMSHLCISNGIIIIIIFHHIDHIDHHIDHHHHIIISYYLLILTTPNLLSRTIRSGIAQRHDAPRAWGRQERALTH